MDFEEVIRKRESVRKFDENKVISNQQLNGILEAGRIAPTAKNIQPQKIIVVQGDSGLKKIDKISPCRYGATTVLIVCSNKAMAYSKENHSTYEIDASIVATQMMLEATNLGVNNIWIEMFDRNILKQEFNLGEDIEPICLIPLGFRKEEYAGSPFHNNRKAISETVIYFKANKII